MIEALSVELKVEGKKLIASKFKIADHLRGTGFLAKSERYGLGSEMAPKICFDPGLRLAVLNVAGSDPRGDNNVIMDEFDSHYDAVQAYQEFTKLIAKVNEMGGELNAT